jgi:HK97 family phage prohead protease
MTRPLTKSGYEIGEVHELRADAETGILSGHASKFWVVDSYAECTAPGCFAKTIEDRGPSGANRILLRYEHEHTIGNHTKMAEDAAGLPIEAKISDDGMYGTAVRRQLADKVPYGLSIGFRRIGDRSATDEDPLILDHAPQWVRNMIALDGVSSIRVLTETKLYENSVVSFPAVDNALVDGYRSEQRTQLLTSLLTDLKAGRLSPDDRAALDQIVQAWIADEAPENSETLSQPSDARTSLRRNHAAELALAELGLLQELVA